MYERRNVLEVKEWISLILKRGYFVITVRLIDGQRLMDWCATN